MNDYEFHADALAQVQARLGDACPSITWGNQPYQIIPGTVIRRADLSAGGLVMNADLRFEALVSVFLSDTIPDVKTLKNQLLRTKLNYLGSNYQVDSVGIRPGGLQIVVDCNAVDQNA